MALSNEHCQFCDQIIIKQCCETYKKDWKVFIHLIQLEMGRERERERERARGEREIVFAGIGKTINRSPYNVYLKTSLKAKLQQLVWPLEAKL